MRVARVIEGAVELHALVAFSVAVVVLEMPEVGDAPGDAAALIGVDADGNVQPVDEGRDLVGASVAGGVFENLDRVAAFIVEGRCGWVFLRDRGPDPASFVEGEVHGFGDVVLGGKELNLKAGRNGEGFLLLRRAEFGRRPNARFEGVFGGGGAEGQESREREEGCRARESLGIHKAEWRLAIWQAAPSLKRGYRYSVSVFLNFSRQGQSDPPLTPPRRGTG